MPFTNLPWTDIFLRIGFMMFVLPTLAAFVPNLDPFMWIFIGLGLIVAYQNLFPAPVAPGGGHRD